MNRRLFFRSLAGAPAAAIAGPPKPAPATARGQVPSCACGFQMMIKSAWDADDQLDGKREGLLGDFGDVGIPADNPTGKHEFMMCVNRRCRYFHRPFAIPQVELSPADPETVRKVEAYEREQERLRREKEAEERRWQEARRVHYTWRMRFSISELEGFYPGKVIWFDAPK